MLTVCSVFLFFKLCSGALVKQHVYVICGFLEESESKVCVLESVFTMGGHALRTDYTERTSDGSTNSLHGAVQSPCLFVM